MIDEQDCPAPDWDNQGDISAHFSKYVPNKDKSIDWEQARKMRAEGQTFASIASQIGCKTGSVTAKASRHDWPIPAATAATAAKEKRSIDRCNVEKRVVALQQAIVEKPELSAEQHVETVKRITATLLHEVIRRGSPPAVDKLENKEILQLHQCLELNDKVARRSYGLDSTEGRVTIGLICSGVMQLPSKEKPAIEVESKSV